MPWSRAHARPSRPQCQLDQVGPPLDARGPPRAGAVGDNASAMAPRSVPAASRLARPGHAAAEGTQLTAFMRFCEERTGRQFADHASFDAFSVREFRAFWRMFLDWSGLLHEGSAEPVCGD